MPQIALKPLTLRFSTTPGEKVDEALLKACTELFSAHYGVWGPKAIQTNEHLKAGVHVKMTVAKLRSQLSLDEPNTILATCHNGDTLVGHAFASCWDYGKGVVCWITQLVVKTGFRRQRIATMLLQCLKQSGDFTAFGLVSSQPASCMALANLACTHIDHLDLSFMKNNAVDILNTTPVTYLKHDKLRGTLFEEKPTNASVVSNLDTEFFVDHKEPSEVLKNIKNEGRSWPLGELLEGHEFLVIVKNVD